MKVVFLHGIGDGDPKYGWLDGLNRGLMQAGHEPIGRASSAWRNVGAGCLEIGA
jgi:hypothetical protein